MFGLAEAIIRQALSVAECELKAYQQSNFLLLEFVWYIWVLFLRTVSFVLFDEILLPFLSRAAIKTHINSTSNCKQSINWFQQRLDRQEYIKV